MARVKNQYVASKAGSGALADFGGKAPRRHYTASKVRKTSVTAPKGKISNPGYIGTDGFGRTQTSRDAKRDSKRREKEIHGPAMIQAAKQFADAAAVELPSTLRSGGDCGIQFKKDLAGLFAKLTIRERARTELYAKQEAEIQKLRSESALASEEDPSHLLSDAALLQSLGVATLMEETSEQDFATLQERDLAPERLNTEDALSIYENVKSSRATSADSSTSVYRLPTDTDSD